MNDEVHYLPVGAEERALLKWLRGSPYRDDLAAVRDALAAAAQAKVPAEALSFSPPASKPSHGDSRLDTIERRLDALERRATEPVLGATSSPASVSLATPPAPPLPAPPAVRPLPAPPSASPPPPPPPLQLHPDTRIAMEIEGNLIQGARVGDFMAGVVTLLTSHGWLQAKHLPFKVGRKRFLLNTVPVHSDGGDFYAPRQVGSVHFETHYSYNDACGVIKKLLDRLGLEYEVVRLVLKSLNT